MLAQPRGRSVGGAWSFGASLCRVPMSFPLSAGFLQRPFFRSKEEVVFLFILVLLCREEYVNNVCRLDQLASCADGVEVDAVFSRLFV